MNTIAEVQINLITVEQDAKNPFFKSKYSTLAAVRRALKAASERGIAIIQMPTSEDVLVTRLALGDEWIESETKIIYGYLEPNRDGELVQSKVGPQQYGSALSYARRYALMAIFALASDDDDDANAAQQSTTRARRQDRPPNPELKAQLTEAIDACLNADELEVLRKDNKWRELAYTLPHQDVVDLGAHLLSRKDFFEGPANTQ